MMSPVPEVFCLTTREQYEIAPGCQSHARFVTSRVIKSFDQNKVNCALAFAKLTQACLK